MKNISENHKENNVTFGVFNKFKVIVSRNYYGEIQEEERMIEGETFERAKFYFNTESLFWSVVSK